MNGKGNIGYYILIVAVVLLVLTNVDFEGAYNKVMGVEKVPGIPGAVTPTGQCINVDTVTYLAKIDDKYAAGTDPSAAADDAIGIFIDGVKKDGSYASGDPMTLSPGQKVDGYYYDDAEDDAMTSANTVKWSFIAPCQGTKDDLIKVLDLGTAGSTAQAWPTDGTAIILSDTYASIKGVTAGYDIPAGGSKCLGKFELSYTNKKGYGSPDGKDCIVFYANKTLIKDIKFTGDGVTDVTCNPQGATTVYQHIGDASAVEIWDFEIPVFDSNKLRNFDVCIEFESDQDGVTTAATSTDDIVFALFDQQWFYNALLGKMELGYEDENHVLIGAANIGENITIG